VLQKEIDETIAQEAVVKAANAKANVARGAVFAATMAQHKAFEAYVGGMTEELKYEK
tara:strand:+ start:161 stop:331 length:171 start_codon:yes stop_codon:yes gene_type:complete